MVGRRRQPVITPAGELRALRPLGLWLERARESGCSVLGVIALVGLMIVRPASAAEVTEFSAIATVSDTARVVVEEHWTYDFGVARPLYVERDISRTRTSNGVRMQVPVRSGWRVPIADVEARIVVPHGVSDSRPRCLLERGVGGVTECVSGLDEGGAWARVTRPLLPGESLQFTVSVPSRTFGRLPLLWRGAQSRLMTLDPWFLMPLLLGFLLVVLAWRRSGMPTGIADEAPMHFGPAEMGAAYGARVAPVDFAATALDLARRGHLNIRRVPTKEVFALSASDWELRRLAPEDSALREYESVVIDALFGFDDSVLLSKRYEALAESVPAFRAAVFNALSAHGPAFRSDPERLASWLRVLAQLVGALGALGWALGYGNFGFSLVLTGVLLMIGARIIPVRTVEGKRARHEIEEFRTYLNSTTPEELESLGQLDSTTFVSMLPYAVVLSAADRWVENFPAVWTVDRPEWVEGEDPLGELGAFMRALKAAVAGLEREEGRYRGRITAGEQSW